MEPSRDLRPRNIGCHSKENNQHAEGQYVRYQRHNQEKLDEFRRAPCSFQISPAVVDCDAGDAQRKDITFDERRRKEDPGVDDGKLGD